MSCMSLYVHVATNTDCEPSPPRDGTSLAAGVLGNLQVPDTKYESIYSVAKDAGVMRMITGTPWFANIVAKQLPFLRGDGTISATYETDETTEATSRPADDERAKVAKTVLEASLHIHAWFHLVVPHP